ncbi:hypothetical protein D3C77_424540 [compost metagenome]
MTFAVGEQHQVGVCLHHLGEPSTVFLGLDAHADIPRDADNLYHRPSIGFANRPAGDLKPQVVTVAMAHPTRHGLIAVLLQGLGRLQQRLLTVLRVKQRLHGDATQCFRPIAEQPIGGRRSIEKATIGTVPRNQVGGVFGDQSIQAPRLVGLTFSNAFGAGVTTTRQHLISSDRDKGPKQNLPGNLRFDIADRPGLALAGIDQRLEITRQPVFG